MKNVTTYVGIDVYKKDLFVGMLMGHQKARVTRQLANEPNAVQRYESLSASRQGGYKCSMKRGRVATHCKRRVMTARGRLWRR